MPFILLDDQVSGQTRYYQDPIHIIKAGSPAAVKPAFEALEAYHKKGYFLAGYTSYELGYVLEPKLSELMPRGLNTPLLHFGVFQNFDLGFDWESVASTDEFPSGLSPSWDEGSYTDRFDCVKEYIEAGDVYQINLTFPIHGEFDGSALSLYKALRDQQPGRYGGVLSLEGSELISLSPELFFRVHGDEIELRPMKGTAKRRSDPLMDTAQRDALKRDPKSKAENLMIVDLLRNDVSRIAVPGSVTVPELFTLETYPTLHQMTSLVKATLQDDVSLYDIFRSLYPCGSITGAPKIRAMEIIKELETAPRGAYCGAMGYMDPNRNMCFNVAIRTMTLNNNRVTYNVGGGLIKDSQSGSEYAEALLKAKVLRTHAPDLIETMRWVPDKGAIRGERHMARMKRSAAVFGYPFSETKFAEALSNIEAKTLQRVKVSLDSEGGLTLESLNFDPNVSMWRIAISKNDLTPDVQETAHKVSARRFYDSERSRVQALTECNEVIFLNENGDICEGSFTSIFIDRKGYLYTPPLECGLLPGILREEMIDESCASEQKLTINDLMTADKIYVGNSLRGLIEVTLTDTARY